LAVAIALSIFGHAISGAAGGAGRFWNFESGMARYPAWIALTLSMSDGLNSCVRITAIEKSVSLRNILWMPSGFSPVQRGPAIMKHPASFPVVRLPMYP
jgi:hypothetical protein